MAIPGGVHDQLAAKEFNAFLPIVQTWSRRAGVQRLTGRPMFPGYLFTQVCMDKGRYIDILKTNGVVRILGERWDRLTPVDDAEIEALQRVVASNLTVLPHPYLREGERVRIERVQGGKQTTFGQLFGDLVVDCPDLPTDLAAQHDHYRLGKPKR